MAEIKEFPSLGPVQMVIVGFDADARFDGSVLEEFHRLSDAGTVRLLDALVVRKHESGEIEALEVSGLEVEEAEAIGAIAGALIGLGAGGEEGAEIGAAAGIGADGHLIDEANVWYVADAIPAGMTAAVALIEHTWAIPLRAAMESKGGIALAESWVHPLDLVAVGALAAEEAGF